MPGPRQWYRELFFDHPDYNPSGPKLPQVYTNNSKQKIKCICKACYNFLVEEQLALDRKEVEAGTRAVCRERSAIIAAMWSAPQEPKDRRVWTSSHRDSLLSHLKHCPRVPEEIRRRAATALLTQAQDTTNPAESDNEGPPLTIVPVTWVPAPPPAASSAAGPSTPARSTFHSHPNPTPLSVSTGSFTGVPPPSISATSASPTPSPSPATALGITGLPYVSQGSSPSYSPSPTGTNPIQQFPSSVAVPAYKRQRPISRSASRDFTPKTTQPVWSDSDQHDFDKHVAHATASANLPLRWVEDPEVIALFQRFVPAAHIPSRKVLTKRLIPTEVNNLRTASHNKTVGALATGQADGWSGGNFHHYLVFMMIADGKVKTVMLHDASSERKDANKLLEHMLQALETMERDHKVTVIDFIG
ncbi:hypothetical protein K474DRAFT_1711580 [Panus rudis PR-1116 ss-1]|nr:hypothetical protein K474DRAFT_1711580 [Panus rudis PR-1116 ss-1]